MEIAGLVIGVAGLAGLFDACSKVYDKISDARTYLRDCDYLDTLLIIQEKQFKEFQIEIERLRTLSAGDSPAAGNNELVDSNVGNELEAEIELDGRVVIIERILRQMKPRLDEAAKLLIKYEVQSKPSTPPHGTPRAKVKLFGTISRSFRPVKWASGDKSALSVIVKELHRLNKGLEKQLPQPSISRLQLGLAADQVLIADRQALQLIRDASLKAGYSIISKSAGIRLACLNQETLNSKTPPDEIAPDFRIESSDVKISSTRESLSRYWTGHMESISTDVLIERRDAFQTSISPGAASIRLNKLVHILQSMYTQPRGGEWDTESHFKLMDFGILQCGGWIIPEKQDFEKIDLVFSYPSNTCGLPILLNSYLTQRQKNKIPKNLPVWRRPPLGARLSVARSLVRLYANFISVGYLHRGVNSHNILFFADNIHQPYLLGVAEARPSQISNQSSQLSKDYIDLELYWPWHIVIREPESSPNRSAWCTSTDLYGLGVILLEIAYWRTASQICGDSSIQDFHQRILPREIERLDYHMGSLYGDAVRHCFTFESSASENALETYKKYSAGILAQLERCSA
ncbi:hypothetical protein N7540_011442 [Penicillium herquei]|nr:hypothetical protein N7540_011442 [Penicillium herquei]